MSQSQRILEHLQEGNSITPLEALDLFGCFRLGARIYDLSRKGYPIESEMITTRTEKKVKKYWIEKTKHVATEERQLPEPEEKPSPGDLFPKKERDPYVDWD